VAALCLLCLSLLLLPLPPAARYRVLLLQLGAARTRPVCAFKHSPFPPGPPCLLVLVLCSVLLPKNATHPGLRLSPSQLLFSTATIRPLPLSHRIDPAVRLPSPRLDPVLVYPQPSPTTSPILVLLSIAILLSSRHHQLQTPLALLSSRTFHSFQKTPTLVSCRPAIVAAAAAAPAAATPAPACVAQAKPPKSLLSLYPPRRLQARPSRPLPLLSIFATALGVIVC